MIKKTLIAGALSSALFAVSTPASAFILGLNNWGFDATAGATIPIVAPPTGLVTPIDELAFTGVSFVDTVGAGIVNGGAFKDFGRLSGTAFANDGTALPAVDIFNPGNPNQTGLGVNYQLSAVFDIPGTWGPTVGANTTFSFDTFVGGNTGLLAAGDSLELFLDYPGQAGAGTGIGVNAVDGTFQGYNDGTSVLRAQLVEGGGNINLNNVAGADGNVDAAFEVTYALPGMWFIDVNGDGIAETDLSLLIGVTPISFAVTDSNNAIQDPIADLSCVAPPAGPETDLCQEFLAAGGSGDLLGIVPGADFYVTNDGSFAPGVEVPEPAALGLAAAGLLAMGGMARRRRQKTVSS